MTTQSAPGPGKGTALPAAVGFMGIALVSFTLMAVSIRELTDTMGPFQILFLRSVVGLALVLTIAASLGRLGQIRTQQFRLQLFRNTIHYAGQWFWTVGIAVLPFATVFALEFTTPAWAALLAVVFLRERMNRGRFVSLICGLIGVVVILRPGAEAISWAALAVLASAFCYASAHTCTKRLTRTDGVFAILFWMSFLQLPMGLIPALFDWTPITWADIPATLGVGVSALGAHYGLTNALKRADTTVVIPLDFLRLPLIATVGFLFYAEAFDPFVLLGGGLIFVGILYSLRWERRVS